MRPEYWNGLPFPSPGDLPNPGIKPSSPALQVDSLPAEPPGKQRESCSVYTVHGILQARVLEWAVIPFSRIWDHAPPFSTALPSGTTHLPAFAPAVASAWPVYLLPTPQLTFLFWDPMQMSILWTFPHHTPPCSYHMQPGYSLLVSLSQRTLILCLSDPFSSKQQK